MFTNKHYCEWAKNLADTMEMNEKVARGKVKRTIIENKK